MECKYREARRFFDNKVELIDTLWNVNEVGANNENI